MSAYLPRSVERVIEEFEKLPGIGPKSAARMAYHFIRSSRNDASRLADALNEMEEKIVYCDKCFNVSENSECSICASPLRDKDKLCIVEEPLDVVAFEKAGVYNGLYFVLGGVISPADGIGAEELRFPQLRQRVKQLSDQLGGLVENDRSLEVIVATNPSMEGEATAAYIYDTIKSLKLGEHVKVSRLAMGLPTGADLEYADRTTLKWSLQSRRSINGD